MVQSPRGFLLSLGRPPRRPVIWRETLQFRCKTPEFDGCRNCLRDCGHCYATSVSTESDSVHTEWHSVDTERHSVSTEGDSMHTEGDSVSTEAEKQYSESVEQSPESTKLRSLARNFSAKRCNPAISPKNSPFPRVRFVARSPECNTLSPLPRVLLSRAGGFRAWCCRILSRFFVIFRLISPWFSRNISPAIVVTGVRFGRVTR